jgi:hypothetical protein
MLSVGIPITVLILMTCWSVGTVIIVMRHIAAAMNKLVELFLLPRTPG